MYLFLNQFAAALPSVIVFWSIAYLLIIKRRKLKVRALVAAAYFAAPTAFLALLAWPARSASFGNGVGLLVPLLTSVISCALLYAHEKPNQQNAHD